jgi:dTDP-4-dehydrorhamnose reductase
MIDLVLEKRPIGVYNLGSHNGMSKADFNFTFIESLKLSTSTMKRIEMSDATFFKAYHPRNICDGLPLLTNIIKQVAKEYDKTI